MNYITIEGIQIFGSGLIGFKYKVSVLNGPKLSYDVTNDIHLIERKHRALIKLILI